MSDEALNVHLEWVDDCAKEQGDDYEALLEKRIAELKAENDVFRNTISLLKNENERLTDGVEELEEENAALKRLVEKQFLFNDVFMERFHTYSRHKHNCTWDQLDKGDICTCGLQELITMYYEIKVALLTKEQDDYNALKDYADLLEEE